jgi:hypothetical protein
MNGRVKGLNPPQSRRVNLLLALDSYHQIGPEWPDHEEKVRIQHKQMR